MTFKKLILLFSLPLLLASCNKGKNATSEVTVRLTDAPGDYDQVNVEVLDVVIKTNASGGWQSLPTQQGIYDLIQLQNGIDTLLATGTVNGNFLQEVRLILGSNNTVMVDSVLYDLTVPSGAESGLKIKVDQALSATINTLIVDFDADLSIHQTGNGKWILQPVLKVN